MTEGTEFYYNLSTGRVEEGRQSPVNDLMGPYSTPEQAQQALTIAADRNEKWEQEDDAWEGDGDASAPAD
ncbi:SPOR domain-containing protein [Brachybacterium sp. FME24]|uniref:SPOR domain-containing protein n=1 Tax=Brachybacterium sp. FME24 TaxID=2742605 RepID=UPI0018673364|nr:SPOR domain-containing protein [Brachybacterium sp. FME24]